MARRAATFWLFPFGFEPAEFFEAHEDGIEGTGGDAGELGKSITVMPFARAVEKGVQQGEGLRRDAQAEAHV